MTTCARPDSIADLMPACRAPPTARMPRRPGPRERANLFVVARCRAALVRHHLLPTTCAPSSPITSDGHPRARRPTCRRTASAPEAIDHALAAGPERAIGHRARGGPTSRPAFRDPARLAGGSAGRVGLGQRGARVRRAGRHSSLARWPRPRRADKYLIAPAGAGSARALYALALLAPFFLARPV
jgi:hypothetical protein